MNDELGIPPEQVLQAFAQMPTQMLEAPAHESIGAFVQNLEIPPQGQARAAQLYANLLERTGQSELSEKLAGMNEGVSFEVMSPRDAALKKLDASLNTLNNTFFRKDGTLLPPDKAQASLEHMDAEISNLMRKKNTQFDNKPVGKDDDGKAALLSTTDFAKSGGLGAMLAAGGEGALDSADAAPVASAASGATAGGSSSLGLMSASSLASPLGAMSSGLGDSGAESDMFGGDSSGASAGGGKASAVSSKTDAAFAQQMKSASAESSMAREMKATDKAPARADAPPVDPNSPNSQALAQGASQAPKAAAVVAGPAGMITNRPATAAEEQENVRELIKEAQVMVKRGGGEMKLEMRPEGMGQVHLRVAVDNGQVSVQMLTESESAKRLIEKGLGELKTSLAAHELKVEHMRVDVGSDIQKQMDQQGTQDQQRQNARAFAQDFMQNFRDENQGFRQGLLENPGWKQYGRKQGSNEIAPEPVAKARARTKDDKRLDLVA